MADKMRREERGKQFMPFAALKGYGEALKKKEKVMVQRAEFSEEYKENLNNKLGQVQKNDIITAVYYSGGECLRITGMVARIDKGARILKIVNTRIDFDDLYDISGDNIVNAWE